MKSHIALALLAAFSLPVFSNTYYFSGTIKPVPPSPAVSIPPGTPFTGTVTFDPSVPHCNCADNQHRGYDFTTGNPPGSWQVHIGSGLYDFTTTSVGSEVDHNYGLFFGGGDVVWLWANPSPTPPVIGGTGQAANPVLFNNLASVLLWSKKAGNILPDPNTFPLAAILNIAQWDFAGIDFAVMQGQSNGEHYRGAFDRFSATPPSGGTPQGCSWCWILVSILLLLVLVLGWLLLKRKGRETAA